MSTPSTIKAIKVRENEGRARGGRKNQSAPRLCSRNLLPGRFLSLCFAPSFLLFARFASPYRL